MFFCYHVDFNAHSDTFSSFGQIAWTLVKGHNALASLCGAYHGVAIHWSGRFRCARGHCRRWCILVIKTEPPFGKLYVSIKGSVEFFYVVWTGCKTRKTHTVVCLQRPGESREDCNSLAVMEKDAFISWNNAKFRCVLFLRFWVQPDEIFMTRMFILQDT